LLPQYGDNRRRLTERWITLFALLRQRTRIAVQEMKGLPAAQIIQRGTLYGSSRPSSALNLNVASGAKIRIAAWTVAADLQLM
jgi:hypothetical protein